MDDEERGTTTAPGAGSKYRKILIVLLVIAVWLFLLVLFKDNIKVLLQNLMNIIHEEPEINVSPDAEYYDLVIYLLL